MQITVLKSKLHRATITDCNLHYNGSCAIDGNVLDKAGIHEYEQIHVYNIMNGHRFITYAIVAQDGSGIISLNGAAARLGEVGDAVIICSYGEIDESQIKYHKPKSVYFKKNDSEEYPFPKVFKDRSSVNLIL
jgi:aspartate 1-decarboxylase